MLQFYRMDHDRDGNHILTPVHVCAIQGDRIPVVPAIYDSVLFYLGIDEAGRMYVLRDYVLNLPAGIIDAVEEWINNEPDKPALPTYYYDTMLLNGTDRVVHLKIVYIAENEDEVWKFVNG